MSQFDFGNLGSPLSGADLVDNNLEPWRNALHSSHSGESQPSYAQAGMLWVSTATSPWALKCFDGSNNITFGTINAVTHSYLSANISETMLPVTSATSLTSARTLLDIYAKAETYSTTEVNNALALKANLASPTFTGVPAAPTAAAGVSTSQIATTAFVSTAVSSAQHGKQLFTSSGTFIVPTGVTTVYISGSGGGGGGGAGYTNAGSTGGATSFGTLVGLSGGSGGTAGGSGTQGGGGSFGGQHGSIARYTGGNNIPCGGSGGGVGGGVGGSYDSAGGTAAANSGSGGGGGASPNTEYCGGGGGGAGTVQHPTPYTVTGGSYHAVGIGAGGAGGGAGGQPGGAGGSGWLLVEW